MITIKPSDGPLEGQAFEVEDGHVAKSAKDWEHSVDGVPADLVFFAIADQDKDKHGNHTVAWRFPWYQKNKDGQWVLAYQMPRRSSPAKDGKMLNPDWIDRPFSYQPAEIFPEDMWVDAPAPPMYIKDPDNDMNNGPNLGYVRWLWATRKPEYREDAMKMVMIDYKGRLNPKLVEEELENFLITPGNCTTMKRRNADTPT